MEESRVEMLKKSGQHRDVLSKIKSGKWALYHRPTCSVEYALIQTSGKRLEVPVRAKLVAQLQEAGELMKVQENSVLFRFDLVKEK